MNAAFSPFAMSFSCAPRLPGSLPLPFSLAVPRPPSLLALALLGVLYAAGSLAPGVPGAAGQPIRFGSADDPREPGSRAPWQTEGYVGLWAGPSLVGPQWRGRLTGTAFYAGPRYAARLEGALRSGLYGVHEPDTDELYDLVRLVDFARYAHREETLALYTRAGPIQQMRLGPAGHLVDFFRSDLSYDERTVGVEAFAQMPYASLGLFTDNVLLNGVTGGRFALQPFAAFGSAAERRALASTEVGLTAATDLGLLGTLYPDSLRPPTAFALDVHYDALGRGVVALSPFASVATYTHYGWGVGAGAALASDNFINLARFAVRLGAFYSSDRFLPGAFNAFYTVSNPRARLAGTDAPVEIAPGARWAGTPLEDVDASAGWQLGLRLLFFERFELTSSYYGHLGSQDLSRYHLRLFFHTPASMRLYVRFDRTGLDHVFSLFGAADDQTAVTFNADYRLPFNVGPAGARIHLRTRYTFERLSDEASLLKRYLPERRFEPSVGLRLRL